MSELGDIQTVVPHKRGEQLTLRLFYGWWIVAAAVLLQFTFLSISQSTVGVFLRPVVEDMGWQVWQFTLGSSLAVMAGALSGVVVGRMVDQRGPRRRLGFGHLPFWLGPAVQSVAFLGTSPLRRFHRLDAVRAARRKHYN